MARQGKPISAVLETLHRLGIEHGVVVTERGNGHFQLRGKLLVNYYPNGKNQTAYVNGTTKGRKGITPLEAIRMANEAPPIAPPQLKDKRKLYNRATRKRILNGRPFVKCHWCPTMIDINTSTLEHIIPLDRGGLDQRSNQTLACKPCNNRRNNRMPELDPTGETQWQSKK